MRQSAGRVIPACVLPCQGPGSQFRRRGCLLTSEREMQAMTAASGPSANVRFSVIDSVLTSQFQDVLYVRFVRDCKTGSLQTTDTELSAIN